MNPKTEEFLNFLFWSANLFARPTFRNLTDSYESWAYRNGLTRQVQRLERRGLVESDLNARKDRLYRLSARGRLFVLGGRDPQERWSRFWDGYWRLVLFDVPVRRNAEREALRRYLIKKGFGWLQQSVWITPDRLDAERHILGSGDTNVGSLVLLEARPCGGESDAQIVKGAWNFDRINSRYARYLELLSERPRGPLRDDATRRRMKVWAVQEREAWLSAVGRDPLLPERLLPSGYLGRIAWRGRMDVLEITGRQIRSFDPRTVI